MHLDSLRDIIVWFLGKAMQQIMFCGWCCSAAACVVVSVVERMTDQLEINFHISFKY